MYDMKIMINIYEWKIKKHQNGNFKITCSLLTVSTKSQFKLRKSK